MLVILVLGKHRGADPWDSLASSLVDGGRGGTWLTSLCWRFWSAVIGYLSSPSGLGYPEIQIVLVKPTFSVSRA